MNIEGKKISIIGAVRSGIGAAKLAKQLGAVPFVSDLSPADKLKENAAALSKLNIDFEFGEHSDRVYDAEIIVTSPGVPSDAHVLKKCAELNKSIVSELEFASWFCKGSIISITGTNGKTTTTSLCAHTLNECGVKTFSAGNIGEAFSEIALSVNENEFVALETSSFQLDYLQSFRPKISVILNVTPDHLDRYDNSFEKYIRSKLNIFKNQKAGEYFIYNNDDLHTPKDISNKEVRKYSFSLNKVLENGSFVEKNEMLFSNGTARETVCTLNDLSIKGEHNAANALAVMTIAKILNLPNDKIKNAFSSFPGVEHRLEFVREIDGVKFINDSKATNIDSVWYALRSFEQPIYLILGGKDKGNDYNRIKELVEKNVKKIYAIGSSSEKVYNFFKDMLPVEQMPSLESCVFAGRVDAEENSVVLLSPACASFDMFDNFEHRGKVFKETVTLLI